MKKDYLSFFPFRYPLSIGNSDIASLVLRTLTPGHRAENSNDK
jgi:hypothetical protein